MCNEDTMITTVFLSGPTTPPTTHCRVCGRKLSERESVLCDKCYKREYEREQYCRDNMTDEEKEEEQSRIEDWDISWRFRK